MASTEDATPHLLRPLALADLAGALALSTEAGWNQTAADWHMMLTLGQGFGMVEPGGSLAASAVTLPYGGRFAWISMVLVTAARQRQGIASRLLGRCIASLEERALVPLLDATPAGRPVYRRLGFRDLWGLQRLAGMGGPRPGMAVADGVAVRPVAVDDWPALAAADGLAFGAERQALLQALAQRLPQAALVAERAGRMAGFLLGRDGRVASQLGPLVAEDAGAARALLATAIARLQGPLYVDLADRHAEVGTWLRSCGFTAERPLIRMILAQDAGFGAPSRLVAVAGPELG